MSLLKRIKQIFHTDPPAEQPRIEPDLVLGKPRQRAPRRNFDKLYPLTAKIEAHQPNPKRRDTNAFRRYEFYLSKPEFVTVGDALKAGWTHREIDYDVNVNHIKVVK